jgi:C_GCAxxG_C_C family probable redox protein
MRPGIHGRDAHATGAAKREIIRSGAPSRARCPCYWALTGTLRTEANSLWTRRGGRTRLRPRRRLSMQFSLETSMSRVDDAVQCFCRGAACSQAILGTYGPAVGLEREQGMKLAAGFAGGMRLAQTCGAVTGAFMVLGLRHAGPNCDQRDGRESVYGPIREFTDRFQRRNSTPPYRCLIALSCICGTPWTERLRLPLDGLPAGVSFCGSGGCARNTVAGSAPVRRSCVWPQPVVSGGAKRRRDIWLQIRRVTLRGPIAVPGSPLRCVSGTSNALLRVLGSPTFPAPAFSLRPK